MRIGPRCDAVYLYANITSSTGSVIYSSLFTENGSNYTVTANQTAGLNKLNYTIIYTTHDMKISNISLQYNSYI